MGALNATPNGCATSEIDLCGQVMHVGVQSLGKRGQGRCLIYVRRCGTRFHRIVRQVEQSQRRQHRSEHLMDIALHACPISLIKATFPPNSGHSALPEKNRWFVAWKSITDKKIGIDLGAGIDGIA